MNQEIDTITILREKLKEYKELLESAAVIIKKTDNPKNFKDVYPARSIFLKECSKQGIKYDNRP